MNDVVKITNLLYRYNELIDEGNLSGALELFKYASFKVLHDVNLQNADQVLANLEKIIVMYPDGTPKTKYVITNPIIEIDDEKGTAVCRSHYTVYQATPDIPLQVIAGGRYHDWLERINNNWRFTYRDYTLIDMVGNIHGHIHDLR